MSPLNRRDFNRNLAAGLGAASFPFALTSGTIENRNQEILKKPNIVFVCSDQHSFKYTGYMNHPHVRTPNLDRIASQGTVFVNHYTGSPVCAPGRTSMMTGMYASDSNSFCNSTVWDGSHPLWTKRLKDAGYYCRATGKLDLSDKYDSGMVEVETSHRHQYNPDITSLFRRPLGYRMTTRGRVDGKPREKRHSDSQILQRALGFLKNETQDMDKPWAMFVGFNQPHPKFQALEKYYNHYYPCQVDMPDIPDGHLEALHLVHQQLRHHKRLATPIPEDRIRRARAAYYGMISELDEYVGALWDQLEKTGQLNNTIFIYTSDHGESLGEHGLWSKNNLYDGAARVPLIISGANIPKGIQVDTPVGHVDIAATMLEWAGVERPDDLRGHSLTPLMNEESGDHPGFVYSECHTEGNSTGSFMIRKGDWKYVHYTWFDDQLFNLKEDPDEFTNRIDDPETTGIQSELKEILNQQVNTEEVTLRAFHTQETMLEDMGKTLTEEELYDCFEKRLGKGQARAMAIMVKEQFV